MVRCHSVTQERPHRCKHTVGHRPPACGLARGSVAKKRRSERSQRFRLARWRSGMLRRALADLAGPAAPTRSVVREAARQRIATDIFDADIIGQAILGAIHQTGSEGARAGRTRQQVVDNLTRFLARALKP